MEKIKTDDINTKQSLWTLSNDGDWKLIFDKDKIQISNNKWRKSDEVNLSLKLGSLVMTPIGIGRLIKLDHKLATIKNLKDGVEDTFEESLITSEFNIFVRLLFSQWNRITVCANGSIPQLKKAIEDLQIVNTVKNSYSLYYDGAELNEDLFFDQLDLRSNAKILLYTKKLIAHKVNIYTKINTGWNSQVKDGIGFTADKKIKLCGVGIYRSYLGKTSGGVVKVFEGLGGDSSHKETLYEMEIQINPAKDEADSIEEIYFNKSIAVAPGTGISIEFNGLDNNITYSGSEGKEVHFTETGVTFSFPDCAYNSYYVQGLIPEIYYHV